MGAGHTIDCIGQQNRKGGRLGPANQVRNNIVMVVSSHLLHYDSVIQARNWQSASVRQPSQRRVFTRHAMI